MSDEIPKLRMAAMSEADELVHNIQREQRASQLQRESNLEDSLAPFRVGSVPYLNAVPLTRGLEEQITFEPPSKLAKMLKAGELDAALLSITEALLNDGYDILDGMAIASLGEVYSVVVAHKVSLGQVKEIYVDTASCTSVNLLKVLLAEKGLKPELKPLESYDASKNHDAVLLIGNAAIEFRRANPEAEVWDLGAAWMELTNLPFVYAVWVLQRGQENRKLRRLLREARDFGLDTMDHIIASNTLYDLDFRKDYLGWHIHYHMGSDEKRGIAKFIELLNKHGLGPTFTPKYVS